MSTLNDLINTVSVSLHSYTGIQEASTHLTADATADALTLSVGSTEQTRRGIIQIDDELIYVDSVADANSLAVAPYGRGYRGSVAAAHTANTQVVFDPDFPRNEVRKAIESCIAGLYPRLFQIKQTTLTYSPLTIGYVLPADVEEILSVKVRLLNDPTEEWLPVFYWSLDANSPEASGKSVNIHQALPVGTDIRVVYSTRFGTFGSASDDLSTIGLPESCSDLVLYGASARLIRFLDPARLQITSVENLSRSQVVQAGDAGKIANQLYAMYQQRLSEERSKLLELTPASIHFTR